MAEIVLASGQPALIDDEDRLIFSRWTWFLSPRGYAARARRRGEIAFGMQAMTPRLVLLHRELMQAPAGFVVDHINGDRLDNRRANLRVCTPKENARNTARSSSKDYKGVYHSGSPNRPWQALVICDGKTFRAPPTYTREQAARDYDRLATKHFGEFARLNFGEVAA